jgi:DNA-binding protein HU-beta
VPDLVHPAASGWRLDGQGGNAGLDVAAGKAPDYVPLVVAGSTVCQSESSASRDDSESKEDRLAKAMSKSELIQKIVEQHPTEIARKDVKGVIEAVAEIGHKELKKTGAFFVPGLAKFVVIKKPATKARKGINPFTKEPTIFKAKPARKIIRARPVKAAKDAVA